MRKETVRTIIRYAAYFLEFLILYTLQRTPHLIPEIWGGKPIFLIPAVTVIAMFEPEIPSLFIGLFAGLMIDFSNGGSLGLNALILCVICYLIASMSEKIIQTNFFTALIICVISVAITFSLNWLFSYLLVGLSYPGYALLKHYLPSFLYTSVLIPFIYFINNRIAVTIHA